MSDARIPLLECVSASVDFDATRALDSVSLTLYPGEIVGLVGPNGAGKTTLGRVISGEIPYGAFDGELRLEGTPVHFRNARDARDAGIVLIHQERSTIDELSIGENVMLTIEPRAKIGIDWPELHRQARQHLADLGVDTDTYGRVADAGVAVQQLVDVARAIAMGRRLFVFDESTAALGLEEVRILLERMREMRDRNMAVVFISHRISEVLQVSGRVVVMRDGRVVLDARREDVDHFSVVRAMLGSEYREFERAPGGPSGDGVRLGVTGWLVPRNQDRKVEVGPINLTVGTGEVLGVFGPLGAGKTELLYSLFGLFGREPSGDVTVDGKPARIRNPTDAIRHGVALIPSERRIEGIATGLSVGDNMVLSHPPGISKFGVLRHGVLDNLCARFVRSLGIKLRSIFEPIDHLSGGNQQKVLLARALAVSPKLMLLDEPTKGIDLGTKVDVYNLIRELAQQGTSCLFSSMEAEEILGIADRILVLRDGHQLAVLDSRRTKEQELVHLATGGKLT